MLQILRDKASGWMIKMVMWALVLAFVGTIFLVWGYGDQYGEQPVAKVGKYSITTSEYQQQYDSLLNQMKHFENFSADYLRSLQLDQMALDALIMEKLQLMEAEKLGISVTDDEMKGTIASDPNFQTNGVFDKDRYFIVLRQSGFNPKSYESLLRREILNQKMTRLVQSTAKVSDNEIVDTYKYINETVNLRYFTLSPALFEFNVTPSEDSLNQYFDKNKVSFTIPEEKVVECLITNPGDYEIKEEIPQSDIDGYYESHRDEFVREEMAHARHIVFRVSENASSEKQDEVMKQAEDVLKKINEGENFGEMAKMYSEDSSSANGGDLGFFGRGSMVPEFEEALFSMKPGEIKGPVRTRFGFHIILLEEYFPRTEMTAEERTSKIRTLLIEKASNEWASDKLVEVVNTTGESGADWKLLADSSMLEYKVLHLQEGHPIAGIKDPSPLLQRAGELNKGNISGPIVLEGKHYMIRVVEINPPKEPSFAEVKDLVEKAYKSEESKRIARDTAASFLDRLRNGEKMDTVTKEMGLEIFKTGFKKRGETLSENEDGLLIIGKGFAMKAGEYDIVESGNRYYIATLLERKAADMKDMDKQRDDITEQLLEQKRLKLLSSWREGLLNKAKEEGIIERNM